MLVDFGLMEIREIKDFARVQHCFGKYSRFRAVQATNESGHEPGGYLVVRNFSNGVAANKEFDVGAGQFVAVAFLANHVNGAHRRGVRHIRLFEAKTLWEQVLDGHGSPALWALEIDGGHGTKFVDHLAAGAARRARHILFASYCNFSD